MAIDTRPKLESSIQVFGPHLGRVPNPTDIVDKQWMLWMYTGITAAAPSVVVGDLVLEVDSTQQLIINVQSTQALAINAESTQTMVMNAKSIQILAINVESTKELIFNIES